MPSISSSCIILFNVDKKRILEFSKLKKPKTSIFSDDQVEYNKTLSSSERCKADKNRPICSWGLTDNKHLNVSFYLIRASCGSDWV